jgi:DNA-binding transcriptional LysR family regulator
MKFQSSLLGKKPKGNITIATIHSVGLYELSDTIKLFIKKYRDIRLHLLYESSQKIYELVEKREVDLGLVAYPVSGGLIEVVPVSVNEMALITSPSLGLKKRGAISLEDLQGMDFVAFSENVPTRKAIDEALAKAGVKVQIRFSNENIETLKKAVEVGLGVSILPLKAIEKDEARQRFDVLRIKGTPLMRPVGIVKSAKYPLNKASELFVNALLKTAGSNRKPAR